MRTAFCSSDSRTCSRPAAISSARSSVAHQHDARARERGIADAERAVDGQAVPDVDLNFSLRSEEGPSLTVCPARITQAFVIRRVLWMRRPAAFGEIARRRANHTRIG